MSLALHTVIDNVTAT